MEDLSRYSSDHRCQSRREIATAVRCRSRRSLAEIHLWWRSRVTESHRRQSRIQFCDCSRSHRTPSILTSHRPLFACHHHPWRRRRRCLQQLGPSNSPSLEAVHLHSMLHLVSSIISRQIHNKVGMSGWTCTTDPGLLMALSDMALLRTTQKSRYACIPLSYTVFSSC